MSDLVTGAPAWLSAIAGLSTIMSGVLSVAVLRLKRDLRQVDVQDKHGTALVLDKQMDQTAQHAIIARGDELSKRMDAMEARHESDRGEWRAERQRLGDRIAMLEGALDQARGQVTQLAVELNAAQREQSATKALAEQLARENAAQSEELAQTRAVAIRQADEIAALTTRASFQDATIARLTRELANAESRLERRASEGRTETTRVYSETGKTNPRLPPVSP